MENILDIVLPLLLLLFSLGFSNKEKKAKKPAISPKEKSKKKPSNTGDVFSLDFALAEKIKSNNILGNSEKKEAKKVNKPKSIETKSHVEKLLEREDDVLIKEASLISSSESFEESPSTPFVFSEDPIINGLIYSEILSKPKSLRND